MNERIKKLADNATHYANGVCDADANADWYETRDQKFAKLIVRECATIAYQWQDEYGIIDDYYTPPPIDNVIKQHFGDEE